MAADPPPHTPVLGTTPTRPAALLPGLSLPGAAVRALLAGLGDVADERLVSDLSRAVLSAIHRASTDERRKGRIGADLLDAQRLLDAIGLIEDSGDFRRGRGAPRRNVGASPLTLVTLEELENGMRSGSQLRSWAAGGRITARKFLIRDGRDVRPRWVVVHEEVQRLLAAKERG